MERSSSNKANNKQTGALGEAIARQYLEQHGYSIICSNYRKPWGEIDVIAKMQQQIHFVEVKTVSYETKHDLELAVAYGTWRPEENVHPKKLAKLQRAIESWLSDYNWQGEWQTDVVAVRIVPRETFSSVKLIENVILG